MPGFTYKSYNFTDKDPILDEVATVIRDCGVNYSWIAEQSGVTRQTLHNWFNGKTKRPQAASINAVFRTMGYKLGPIPDGQSQIIRVIPPMIQRELKPYAIKSTRHLVQMAKFSRRAK